MPYPTVLPIRRPRENVNVVLFNERDPKWYLFGTQFHVIKSSKLAVFTHIVLLFAALVYLTACLLSTFVDEDDSNIGTKSAKSRVPNLTYFVPQLTSTTSIYDDFYDIYDTPAAEIPEVDKSRALYVLYLVFFAFEMAICLLCLQAVRVERANLVLPYLTMALVNCLICLLAFRPTAILLGVLQAFFGLIVFGSFRFFQAKARFLQSVFLGSPDRFMSSNIPGTRPTGSDRF